jgi:hypothetical protein
MRRNGPSYYDLTPHGRRITGGKTVTLPLILLISMVVTGYALAEQPVEMPKGPVPTVDANMDKAGDGIFMKVPEGVEKKLLPPNHPPIGEIMPMPMPKYDENTPKSEPQDKGSGIIYNPETKETIILPPANEPASSNGATQGGGYEGADGGSPFEEMFPASMSGSMSKITNTADAPWRMNTKVVIRLGTSYAVCSGSMIDASTVLTAGHCVYNRDTDFGPVGWVSEIWVYPGWDGNANQWAPPPTTIYPYGYGNSTSFASWTGWTASGDLNNDIGVIRITRPVGVLTGWYGWSADGTCAERTAQTYNNGSYPAEGCGTAGLHNGSDMYYWSGNFDSCPTWNRIQLTTPLHGCFGAIWGGMSGSSAYFIDGGNRYIHAVTSTSNRYDSGTYTRQWSAWTDWVNGTFIPGSRGATFDLAPLNTVAEPATINAGSSTTLLNHLATNATNGTANGTWNFGVYFSSNDTISTGDTLLSSQYYTWNFGAMGSVRVNMGMVTIPKNTPTGDYWLGLVYDSTTDGNSGNNDTSGWDAAPIHVNGMPDLVIQSITTTPASPTNQTAVSVTVTIRNEGGAAAGSFWVDIFKDQATAPVPAGGLAGDNYCSFAGLAAGASATCTRPVYYPNPGTGTYHIWATVDTNVQVAESFENNNVSGPHNIFVDANPPVVNDFRVPDAINSLTIPITGFTATDNSGAISGYLVTTTATKPSSADPGWSATAPTGFNVASAGTYTLYAWARDLYGNVSDVLSAPPVVLVDLTLPTVTGFAVTTPVHTLTVPITTFTSSDNVAVTGWLVTISDTKPAATDPAWGGSKPANFIAPYTGNFTLHAWVKDASGNVSDSASASAAVVMLTANPLSISRDINFGDTPATPLTLYNYGAASTAFGLDQQAVNTDTIPATGLPNPWVAAAAMPTPAFAPASAVVNGKFYVLGGDTGGAPLWPGKSQMYDPATGTWDATLPDMPTPAGNLCAGVIGTDIYVPGGNDNSSTPLTTLQVFHTTTRTWETIATDPLPAARWGAACTAYNNQLYVFGGFSGASPTNTAWVYVPALPAGSRWVTSLAAVPVSDLRGSAITAGSRIFYLGAQNNARAVYAYDPAGNSWSTYPSLASAHSVPGVWLLDNVLYVGGGLGTSSVEQYDLGLGSAGVWLPAVGSLSSGPDRLDNEPAAAAPPAEVSISPAGSGVGNVAPSQQIDSGPLPNAAWGMAYGTDPVTGILYAAGGYAGGYLTTASTSAITPASWLTIAPQSGNLNSGANTPVSIGFNTTGLAVGSTYRARIALMGSAPNTIRYLPVTVNIVDTSAPTVTAFTTQTPVSSPLVTVLTFTAGDNVGVTGYKITESSTPPTAGGAGWSATPPASFALTSYAVPKILYAWAKDVAGHVSPGRSFSVTVNDVSAPTVTAFTIVQALDNFLKLNVTAFTATDNFWVTGYMITESSTPPAAGAAGWNATPPASFTLPSYVASKTLFAWVKDGAGHVSAIRSATVPLGQPVQVQDTGALYTSLQTAYNAVSTSSATIKAWATLLTGNVLFGSSKTITLNGGYDNLFGAATGMTTVNGTFTIGRGQMIVDRLIIK